MTTRILLMFVIAIWSVMANIAMAQQNETVSEEYDHVTKVNVGEDNFLYIAVRGNFKTRHPCTNRSFVRSLYPISDDRTKAWLQIATASFLSRSKIHIWTRDCAGKLKIAGDVGSGYPIMIKLQLFQ